MVKKLIVHYVVPHENLLVQSFDGEAMSLYLVAGEFYRVVSYFDLSGGKVPVVIIKGKKYYPLRSKYSFYSVFNDLDEAAYNASLVSASFQQHNFLKKTYNFYNEKLHTNLQSD